MVVLHPSEMEAFVNCLALAQAENSVAHHCFVLLLAVILVSGYLPDLESQGHIVSLRVLECWKMSRWYYY